MNLTTLKLRIDIVLLRCENWLLKQEIDYYKWRLGIRER